MKKYLILLLAFLLVGCGKINKADYINYVTNNNYNIDKPLTASYDVFKTIIKEDEKINFPDFSRIEKFDRTEYVIYNNNDGDSERYYEVNFYDNEDPLLYTYISIGYKIGTSFSDPEDNKIKTIDGKKYKYSKLVVNEQNYYDKQMCLLKDDYTFCVLKVDSNEITNEDLLEYLNNF